MAGTDPAGAEVGVAGTSVGDAATVGAMVGVAGTAVGEAGTAGTVVGAVVARATTGAGAEIPQADRTTIIRMAITRIFFIFNPLIYFVCVRVNYSGVLLLENNWVEECIFPSASFLEL
jgi:hypothetical protein